MTERKGLKAKMEARDERQINKLRNPKAGKQASPNGLRFRVPADPRPKHERRAGGSLPCTLRPRRRRG